MALCVTQIKPMESRLIQREDAMRSFMTLCIVTVVLLIIAGCVSLCPVNQHPVCTYYYNFQWGDSGKTIERDICGQWECQ